MEEDRRTLVTRRVAGKGWKNATVRNAQLLKSMICVDSIGKRSTVRIIFSECVFYAVQGLGNMSALSEMGSAGPKERQHLLCLSVVRIFWDESGMVSHIESRSTPRCGPTSSRTERAITFTSMKNLRLNRYRWNREDTHRDSSMT